MTKLNLKVPYIGYEHHTRYIGGNETYLDLHAEQDIFQFLTLSQI